MYKFGNVKEGGFFIDGDLQYRRVPESTSEEGVFNAVSIDREGFLSLYADSDEIQDIPSRADRKSQLPLEDIFDQFRSRISDVRLNAEEAAERGNERMAGWYEEDAGELQEVLDFAMEGKWARALSGARLIDTAVREYIPREMMNEIYDRVSKIEEEESG